MALIVPTGSPAWTRAVSFEDFGGHAEKANYLSRGSIDALTDVSAAQFARLTADAAALTRVAPFAVLTVLCQDSVPDFPTFETVHLMIGVQLASYEGDDAPVGYPTAVRNGTGDITITFASSYTDSYGVLGAFSIQHAKAGVIHTAVARAVVEALTTTTIRIRAFDATDAALSNARITLTVW